MICFAFLLMSQMSSKSHFPSLGYSSKFLQFCFCLYWGFFVCFWRQRVASFFSLLSISWPDWLVFFLQAQAYVYKGKHKYTNSYMNKIWYAALSPSLLMFFFFHNVCYVRICLQYSLSQLMDYFHWGNMEFTCWGESSDWVFCMTSKISGSCFHEVLFLWFFVVFVLWKKLLQHEASTYAYSY